MIIQKLLLLSLCVVTNADESRLIDYALDDLVNQAYEAMHRAEILKKQHGSISNSLAVDAAALWYKNARDASQLELSVLQPTLGALARDHEWLEKKIKTFGAPQKAYAKLVNRQAKEAFYNAQDCVKGIADNFFLGTPRDECATLSWTNLLKDPFCTDIDQISYHYVDQELDWESANSYCRRKFHQGSLATFHNQEELEKFKKVVPSTDLWVGARRDEKEYSRFFWLWSYEARPTSKGSELLIDDYLWNAGEPSNVLEECVEYKKENRLNDANCSIKRRFVCSSRCIPTNANQYQIGLRNPRFGDSLFHIISLPGGKGHHYLHQLHAIDGEKTGNGHRFAHSYVGGSTEFLADFPKHLGLLKRQVLYVVVYPRRDCCFDRYRNMRVFIDHDECQATDVFDSSYLQSMNFDVGLKFHCSSERSGRSVRVTTPAGTVNQIAELEVICRKSARYASGVPVLE